MEDKELKPKTFEEVAKELNLHPKTIYAIQRQIFVKARRILKKRGIKLEDFFKD